jgi:hypothetical protein
MYNVSEIQNNRKQGTGTMASYLFKNYRYVFNVSSPLGGMASN